MVPTIVFCVLFNTPKFFELEIQWEEDEAGFQKPKMAPTELRLDETYVFLYVNLARFLVTGVLPFVSLVILNMRIHR